MKVNKYLILVISCSEIINDTYLKENIGGTRDEFAIKCSL